MQQDLFSTNHAAFAIPPNTAPAEETFTGLAELQAALRRYRPTTRPAGECAVLDADAWRPALAAYLRLMLRFLATPIAERPLPGTAGLVLEHLHKLDLWRIGHEPGGAPVILLPAIHAATAALRRLTAVQPQEATQ
jgi:hypothetical protein